MADDKRFYLADVEGHEDMQQLVDRTTGRVLGYDCGEPEDNLFRRDWRWVVDELNALNDALTVPGEPSDTPLSAVDRAKAQEIARQRRETVTIDRAEVEAIVREFREAVAMEKHRALMVASGFPAPDQTDSFETVVRRLADRLERAVKEIR